ncbi:YkvA family protein [Spirillospora sp. NPDC050679]
MMRAGPVVVGLGLIVAGVVLTFVVDRTAWGVAALLAGAVLVIAGIARLRRARRVPGTALEYRTGKRRVAAMVAAVVYIVSPIDLVPDFLLPLGIVDDASALTWLLFALGQEYTRRSRLTRG